MIAALRGRVLSTDEDQLVLEASGVGYQVFCHLRTIASLHDSGDAEVALHIHTSVSDDAIRLYGFLSGEELRLFRLLIGVERIGPRAALSIMGRAELPALVRAIRSEDVAMVATVPGVGRKTAERVILELRDKLDAFGGGGVGAGGAPAERAAAEHQAVSAAIEGLVNLGFKETAARAAVAEVAGEGELPVGALVGAALRRLDTVGSSR
ncbi:MAG: Holliday junction branch migration protein RuvA [Candidatus Dormibacteria bacterium]